MSIFDVFFKVIAKKLPSLPYKLKRADLKDKPEYFVKKTVVSALYVTAAISLFLVLLLLKLKAAFLLLFTIPLVFIVILFYLFNLPNAMIRKEEKAINREIVFATRFLIIELESGVPLYNALGNVSKNYEVVGAYFKKMVDKVNLGTSMEDALNEIVEKVPSEAFRRVLWQIINSIKTGTNVNDALASAAEQIAREQKIEMERYGKKLNPLAMFYMIVAVILPSLGITMLIILSTFIKFELNLTILLMIAFLLAFVQFMFLSVIKFSRPAVEL